MDTPDSSEPTGWATFIGIVICLCGNVTISFALNIQRLAHERIQRKQSQEIERNYGIRRQNTLPKMDNVVDDAETRYLKSKLWWTGLILMAIGETGNFVACIALHLDMH